VDGSELRVSRRLGDAGVYHGEGAFWDARDGVLRHVDMLAGDIVTWRGDIAERAHLADVVAVIRRRRANGFVIATERGFALLDDELRLERDIAVIDAGPTGSGVRMNEGACDAAGRLFVGSMGYDFAPGAGALYRLDPDLSVHVVLPEVTIPNGLVWTRDGATALHADTADAKVYAYEYDAAAGMLGAREVFVDFAGLRGGPDGMALDAEGGLWVAAWGGGRVYRFDTGGALTAEIDVGTAYPTSCAFGGTAGTTLFVTTSRDGAGARLDPSAGQVVEVEVGVPGAEVFAFAG
jgi:sugar lactone lactonase YvrE